MRPTGNPIVSRRSAGVLLHLSSLDGPFSIGDLGPRAHEFAGWCASAGFSWWQMLPVGPVGKGDSPYSSTSSFAGEPLLVSLEGLLADGLLSRGDLRRAKASVGRRVQRTDYSRARNAKGPAFRAAFDAFTLGRGALSADYRAFESRTASWLSGWRRFTGDDTGFHAFLQFQFDRQWRSLRKSCSTAGVRLLGDLPLFVTLESADVADHPELFRLDRRGRPVVVTGVPPDCFSRDGQLWGHPHYRWSAHRREHFAWWIARIAAALQRFDALRIDHFVGLHHAYEINASARNARRGVWRRQAGMELLSAARRSLGRLPLLAEDLGAVTDEVVAMRRKFDLPGMRVLHHAFDEDDSSSLPRHLERGTVVYTGTHDNNTTRGWWADLDARARRRLVAYAGQDARQDPAGVLLRLAFESPAALAIAPMQDFMRLRAAARMNIPGKPDGNWRWRLATGWRSDASAIAHEVRLLASVTARRH